VQPFVHVRQRFDDPASALAHARDLLDDETLEVLGDFVIPTPGPSVERDFQTLHLDFGLPVRPVGPGDVARFTALHVPVGLPHSGAATRFVRLSSLRGRGGWPDLGTAVRRLEAYGRSHGAHDDRDGYREGSLARICEAVLSARPALPSLKENAGFLCGTEFAALADERDFLAGLGLDVVESEVVVAPGELLVFENLAVAHGRRGVRGVHELHQRVFGHRALDEDGQRLLRDRVLVEMMGGPD